MATPIHFPDTTTNLSLPLLFSGQAQKEFTLNQSLTLLDALLHGVITGSATAPPSDAAEGSSYRVLENPTDSWSDRDDQIAIRIGGTWHFVSPVGGMSLFDRTLGTRIFYREGWQLAVEPDQPEGGEVIDVQARSSLAQVIEVLRVAGLIDRPA